MIRFLALTIGPVLLVGLSYLVTHPDAASRAAFERGFGGDPRTEPIAPAPATASALDRPVAGGVVGHGGADAAALAAVCRATRDRLLARLGPGFVAVVHPPFVLAGDQSAAELDRHYLETIRPTARALALAYFDRRPTAPVSIVVLGGAEAYQRCADRLDGQRRAAFAGYYERSQRRIVLNASTGDGTLAHELTHALAHFDFPSMPEWFDEGLASLQEEAQFSADGLRIRGLPNWRWHYLQPAIKSGSLPPLESMIRAPRVRAEQQAIDYAQARYLCLFLQERGLLEPFYRKFRLAADEDPTGLATLCGLFGVEGLSRIDAEFRAWALESGRPATASAGAARPAAGRPASGPQPSSEPENWPLAPPGRGL
jgi:hypothetical protein